MGNFLLRVVSGILPAMFLRSVHTFSQFLKSNWCSDFGHAETRSGAKKRVILQLEWANGVWTKIRSLASGFLFTSGNFNLIFTVLFSIFRIGFFLNGFYNLFIVHSRPGFFVWTKFPFLASGFLFPCGILTLIFCFFFKFLSDFIRNGFPNSFIIRSRSSFCFRQWKFFELYVRTCPAIFFYFLIFILVNSKRSGGVSLPMEINLPSDTPG